MRCTDGCGATFGDQGWLDAMAEAIYGAADREAV
jgi:hypothetical protein